MGKIWLPEGVEDGLRRALWKELVSIVLKVGGSGQRYTGGTARDLKDRNCLTLGKIEADGLDIL